MRPTLRTAKMPTKPQPGHSAFRKLATPPTACAYAYGRCACSVCLHGSLPEQTSNPCICRQLNKCRNHHIERRNGVRQQQQRLTALFWEYRDRYHFPTQAQHAKSPACTVRATPQNLGTRIGMRPVSSKRGSILLGGNLVPAPTHYSASSGSGSSSKRTSILSMRRPSITRAIIVIFVPS